MAKADSGLSAVLHRDLHYWPLPVVEGEGNNLILADGRRIFEASGGAAVACLGYSHRRVREAITKQINKVSYAATTFYTTEPYEQLCRFLVQSTGGHMARAYIVNSGEASRKPTAGLGNRRGGANYVSGSEAVEAAMKLARQFFLEKNPPEPQRVRFVARNQSYHGTTLGSLSLGGHVYRRHMFEPMLLDNISRVSPCYAYRGKHEGESDVEYVARLSDELDAEFQRVGPETVCAFFVEPVVGAVSSPEHLAG